MGLSIPHLDEDVDEKLGLVGYAIDEDLVLQQIFSVRYMKLISKFDKLSNHYPSLRIVFVKRVTYECYHRFLHFIFVRKEVEKCLKNAEKVRHYFG